MGNTLKSKKTRHLRRAIRTNDVTMVERVISLGVNVDLPLTAYARHTPLILATCDGSYDVLRFLLEVVKHKNTQNREGHTALDKAITYYSLANEFVKNKPHVIEKRKRILALLVQGGCSVVREWEFELWIRVNKGDPVFLQNIVHILCQSKSSYLLSLSLSVMVKINAPAQCALDLLCKGATYEQFKRACERDELDRVMLSNELCITLIKSTNDPYILKFVETTKKHESNGESLPKHIVLLLLLSSHRCISSNLQDASAELSLENRGQQYAKCIKSLSHLCRVTIRKHLYPNVFYCVPRLPLPKKLQYFIAFNVVC